MRFRDIPQYTRWATYAVDVSWSYLKRHVQMHVEEYGLNLDPDFQRGYVWTPEQKVRYVEFVLQGGAGGRDIQTNHPNWNGSLMTGDYVLVDGKQRLNAVLGFLDNDFPIFGGNYLRDYEDAPHILTARFRWHVNDLATRTEVLQWYLDLNAGGTVHTAAELDKVRGMISEAVLIPKPKAPVKKAPAQKKPKRGYSK
jgi:hypothetical protein